MRNLITILLAILLAIALAGCTSTAPQFEADPSADLVALKHFAWSTTPRTDAPLVPMDSEIFQKRVRLSATSLLVARGYTVDETAPEFRIRSNLLVKKNAKAAPKLGISLGTGSYGGHFGSSVSVGGSTDIGKAQDQLTLVLEVRDAKSDELLWQGWREVSAAVGDPAKPVLDATIKAILGDFPVSAKRAAQKNQKR